MHDLERYGWNDHIRRAFEAIAGDGLEPGRVTAEHRGAYDVRLVGGDVPAEVTGRMRYEAEARGDLPAVGDWVAVTPMQPRAVIRSVLPRTTKLSRKAAGLETVEQVLAANVDVVFVVTAADRDLNARRVERYLALAWEGGAEPVIVLTKTDLSDDPLQAVATLGPVALSAPIRMTSAVTGEGIDELREWFRPNRTVALLGSSGVGKSTLTNRLLGFDAQDVAELRSDGRGRHTTSARQLIPLPDGGLVLDTPGMRELALWDGDGLAASFEDVQTVADGCRFRDCRHEREPGCAVRAAVRDGHLDPARLAAWRKLEREQAFLERRQDRRASANEKRRWKAITKAHRQRARLERDS